MPFEKNHISWNKDKKGIHLSPKSEFKKGQVGYWAGKKRPDISEKLKGHFVSEETKRKISRIHKGRFVGKKNWNWNGGKFYANGYVYIYKPEHPFGRKPAHVLEHRLVMEKHIGRYITPTERIHHINGIKDDNRIENLLLCDKEDNHRALHNKMEKFMFKLLQEGKVYYDKSTKDFKERREITLVSDGN